MGFSSENIPFSHENHGIFITFGPFSPFAPRGRRALECDVRHIRHVVLDRDRIGSWALIGCNVFLSS